MAVSLDGVMVPMKAGQRKEKRAAAAAAGKPTRGPAGYCEAACATVTVYDHERAPLHTVHGTNAGIEEGNHQGDAL